MIRWRFREVMDASGHKLAELVEASGVSRAAIGRLRQDKRQVVNLDHLDALCGVLGVRPCAVISYAPTFGEQRAPPPCPLRTLATGGVDVAAHLVEQSVDRQIRKARTFEAAGGVPHHLRGQVERALQSVRADLLGATLPEEPKPARHPLDPPT